MDGSARNDYLYAEVMTAAPQKLQLMLLEAAIRLVHRTRHYWTNNQDDAASEALIHCQQVVTELLAGLNSANETDLIRRVASVYTFIYRSLVLANFERSEEKLADALRVLETERETWLEVCRQLGSQRAAAPLGLVG